METRRGMRERRREEWGHWRASNPLVSRWRWGEVWVMHRPGMWSLSRAAGQTGVPSQQLVLWQVDVVLASYMGLNSADITAAYPTMCVFVCVRVCVWLCHAGMPSSRSLGGGPVTRLTSLATQNAIVSIWLGAKWVVFLPYQIFTITNRVKPSPRLAFMFNWCFSLFPLSPTLVLFSFKFSCVSGFLCISFTEHQMAFTAYISNSGENSSRFGNYQRKFTGFHIKPAPGELCNPDDVIVTLSGLD